MHDTLGSAANEPADTMVVITAHHQHVDVMAVHEQSQDLGWVAHVHVAMLAGDAIALGQCLEGLTLGFVKCLGEVGVE